jgi:dTMP kinase
MENGILIAIEGIDGSGKSSVMQPLKEALEKEGHDVVKTKEPGDTTLGKSLRRLLHEEKKHICDKSEYLLFAADRAQHFEEIVIPALDAGKIVISDRLNNSSVAYQGYGRELNVDMIKKINSWAMNDRQADIIVYLELDYKTGLQRTVSRGEKQTSFEAEQQNFWKRVSSGFENIFKDKKNVIKIDASQPIEAVIEQKIKKGLERLSKL